MSAPDPRVPGQASALDSVGAALAVVDARGRLVRWTEVATRLLGYAAADVLGRPVSTLLDGPDGAPPDLTCEWAGPAALRHQSGGLVDVDLRVTGLPGPAGTLDWLVSTAGVPPSVLESAAELSPFPMAIWDSDLRTIWLNHALAERFDLSREERLGRHLETSPLYENAEQVTSLLREVLESGVPVIDRELNQLDPLHHRAYALSVFRIEDVRGGLPGVCSVNVDVTESRRARDRMTLLGRAATSIGTNLDVWQTAQDLADLLVPLMADYATVDLAESVGLGDAPLTRLGPLEDGNVPAFHRAGMASIHDDFRESLFARGTPVFVPPHSPFVEVLSSGRTHMEPRLDTEPGTWLEEDPQRLRMVLEQGMHSLLILPVHARNEILGITVLVRTDNPTPFDENDRTLAEELVSRAALSLDNARRYTREHTMALTLQRSLLPRNPNAGFSLETIWRYLPADTQDGVGGDWFDVIPLCGARIALVVGDVVGHGLNAAAAMGRIRTAVSTLAGLDLAPEQLLSALDDLVVRLGYEDDDDAPTANILGATCVYAVYDPTEERLTVARAGHPPPAVIAPDGTVDFPEVPSGAPLGVGLRSYTSVDLELPAGSVIALYTDGLVESREGDIDDGLERLRAALTRPPGTPLEDLCSAVVELLPDKGQDDDVALLIARACTFDADRVFTVQVPADPEAVGRARAEAVRQLSAWGLDRLGTAAEQIVGELLANAVRHGAGPVRLRLIRHWKLACEVFDAGPGPPLPRHPGPDDEGGRGLVIIGGIAARWGSRRLKEGKIVWAELPLTDEERLLDGPDCVLP
ncbi:SpoIIE family protein phosphatase [Actinacidiphila sp. bgisy167]|uniref:SpoIIE family protein phosphatase n=1 Tax=Actinacidiphila sp. bgisy167 TaxID=3413797 RepID=UPI003D721662